MNYEQKKVIPCQKCGTQKYYRIIESNKGLCDSCHDKKIRMSWNSEQRARWAAIEAPLSAADQKEIDAGINQMFRRGAAGALD